MWVGNSTKSLGGHVWYIKMVTSHGLFIVDCNGKILDWVSNLEDVNPIFSNFYSAMSCSTVIYMGVHIGWGKSGDEHLFFSFILGTHF